MPLYCICQTVLLNPNPVGLTKLPIGEAAATKTTTTMFVTFGC